MTAQRKSGKVHFPVTERQERMIRHALLVHNLQLEQIGVMFFEFFEQKLIELDKEKKGNTA